MDTIKNLIPSENKTIIYEYFNNNKFLDIFNKKYIICVIKNKKGRQSGGVNYDKMLDKLKKYDMDRRLLLDLFYGKESNLKIDKSIIDNYIYAKCKFDIKSLNIYNIRLYYDSENIKITLGTNNTKYNIIESYFTQANFIKVFDKYTKIIFDIIENKLKVGDSVIIYEHILVHIDFYPEYIKKLCRHFKTVKLIFCKNFLKNSSTGYLLLKNKVSNTRLLDVKFDTKYEKFKKKMFLFFLKNYELSNNIIKLHIINPNGYYLLINRIRYVLTYY
jgi:hypothetical protein